MKCTNTISGNSSVLISPFTPRPPLVEVMATNMLSVNNNAIGVVFDSLLELFIHLNPPVAYLAVALTLLCGLYVVYE